MSAFLRTVKSLTLESKDLKYESSRTRTTSYNDENIALKSDVEAVNRDKNGTHTLLRPHHADIENDEHEDEDEEQNGCNPTLGMYQQHINIAKDNQLEDSSSDSDNTRTTTTTTTITTTVATSQSQKFVRLRGLSKNGKKSARPVRKSVDNDIYDIDERNPDFTRTELSQLSQTEASQLTCTRQITYHENGDMTALTEVTETTRTQQYTQTETPSTMAGDGTTTSKTQPPPRPVMIVVSPGDEIKCCYTFDVYNGLYAIFTYQLVIALLLIVIVVWAFLCTDFAWLVSIWALSFMLLRFYCSIFGFMIVPKMAGLHGDELTFLKMRYLNYIKAWSVLLLYGVIICNAFLLLGFFIYGCVLGVQLSKPENSYSHHTPENMLHVSIYQNVDHFTAKFWLFCMGIITAILIIDTIGEIMCYDTIKKFVEAKLQCSLCAIPCSCAKD